MALSGANDTDAEGVIRWRREASKIVEGFNSCSMATDGRGCVVFLNKKPLEEAGDCGRCCRKVGDALAPTEVSKLELFAPVAFDSAVGTGVVEYPAAQSLAGLQDIGGERR